MLEQAQDRGCTLLCPAQGNAVLRLAGPQGQGCYGHVASELCGHKSKATTEKYSKARWRETAALKQLKKARCTSVQYPALCPAFSQGGSAAPDSKILDTFASDAQHPCGFSADLTEALSIRRSPVRAQVEEPLQ